MFRRRIFGLAAAAVASIAALGAPAHAQQTVKVGLILPMTGPFASTGKQIEASARLYIAQKGAAVAGKRIELVVRDDTGVPDVTRRIAQELLVNERVNFLAGFGLTPLAMATAPLATQARTPMIVMAAATAAIVEASPFIVRTSFTLPQAAVPLATWAAQNDIKSVATLVTDYAPGIDAERSFKERFARDGRTIPAEVRVPLRNPDFAPFLQRVADVKPDALFVFVPSGVGAQFMKQFRERGLDRTGIRLIGTGDITDDDILDEMGDVALGVVTTHHYSAAHPSALNRNFVQAYKAANRNARPNFMGVGGYDGMHVVYESLRKTGGNTDGQRLIDAMKDMAWESPRGPVRIDAATREIVQNIYVRRVERVGGELQNVEFATFLEVFDPSKQR